MAFCAQCGSASRDKDGFCGGCGAPWPLAIAAEKPKNPAPPLPFANLPRGIGMAEVKPKLVWFAVLLGLLFGPFGLLYCTMTGAIVMLIVSVALSFWHPILSLLLVQPACALWAWRAARESASAFD